MPDEETLQKTEAKFNAGLAKLSRIDSIKKRLHIARLDNDMHTIRNCLISFRRELHERMNKEQIGQCDKLENNVNFYVDHVLNPKGVVIQGNITDPLPKYEAYLCELEYSFGMSLTNKEDSRFSIGS